MKRDNVMPKGKWTFNKEVSDSFDDMLQRSIPQYSVMRDVVFKLGKKYVKNDTYIVDLGCSKGTALEPFIEQYKDNNRYVGIEISKPMLEESRRKFEKYIDKGFVEIESMDLRNGFPQKTASVVLSILTLQFIPIEYRQNIIQNVYSNLVEGGAFILVEKVLGNTAEIDKTFVDLYSTIKHKNGYSYEQIERKKLSLEGVLVPITSKWNEEILKNAGFQRIDCFWRYLNFSGWVAIK